MKQESAAYFTYKASWLYQEVFQRQITITQGESKFTGKLNKSFNGTFFLDKDKVL